MNIKQIVHTLVGLIFGASLFLGANAYAADKMSGTSVYDAAGYTSFVKNKMEKLDKLYLDFCDKCNVNDSAKAAKARQEFFINVGELMEVMNARFDGLDPEKGAALSSTETLVSIHVLTMLVDILAETQMHELSGNPYTN